MKREDLFLAIGEVEEDRLQRSEMTGPSGYIQEDNKMGKFEKKRTGRRIRRNLMIAAVIVSMLAVTAYAVGGYVIFNSPEEMITAIFGDETGYDHKGVTTWTDPWKPGQVYESPAYDREPVDETVMAENIVPHVSAVGQSISWQSYTLTVDTHLYDSNTRCGVLTYTLENPDGIKEYNLQNNGEVWYSGGDPVYINQHFKGLIVEEKTTDTCLTVACYYVMDKDEESLEITFSKWTVIDDPQEQMQIVEDMLEEARQTVSPEDAIAAARAKYGDELYEKSIEGATQEDIETAAYYDVIGKRFDELYTCPDKIIVDCSEMDALDHVTAADGDITITPINIQVDISNMEFLQLGVSQVYTDNISSVTICYEDGTEYIVTGENVMNSVLDLNEQTDEGNYNLRTIIFNRIIDIDNITSVIINDTEFPVE